MSNISYFPFFFIFKDIIFFLSKILSTNEKYSIEENGLRLKIKNLNENDAGEYSCLASNKIGEKKVMANLKIIGYENNQNNNYEETYNLSDIPSDEDEDNYISNQQNDNNPNLQFTQMPSDTEALEGSSTRFICNVNNPSYKIDWLKVI